MNIHFDDENWDPITSPYKRQPLENKIVINVKIDAINTIHYNLNGNSQKRISIDDFQRVIKLLGI